MVYEHSQIAAIPVSRAGHPLELTGKNGEDTTIPNEELLDLVPDFCLDNTTAALFGGDRVDF